MLQKYSDVERKREYILLFLMVCILCILLTWKSHSLGTYFTFMPDEKENLSLKREKKEKSSSPF
jgi:hypothetical protein